MRFVCIALLFVAVTSFAASNDHLVPRSNVEPEYHQVVRGRLGVTSFDCGRIIVTPDLGPEAAIAVYSKDGRFCITETAASGHGFWQARETHERVKVVRVDAEVSARTAKAIREALLALLKDVRPDASAREVVAADVHLFEVSVQTPKGVLTADVPREKGGPHTKAVELLFQSLVNYCEAHPSKRKPLDQVILSRLSPLLSRPNQALHEL
jgi:hypothetical protein